MMSRSFFFSVVLTCVLWAAAATAQGLRVSPTTLEVKAPGAATTLTLVNQGRTTMTVQARIFRWTQANGREQFDPTGDVVVSPPMVRLAPGQQQVLRIVRTTRRAVRGEEAYRLYIDQIPDRLGGAGGTVNFASRLRIPVFFPAADARPAGVQWSLLQSGNRMVLQARNTGDVRLRIADVRLVAGGTPVLQQGGLFGYVLGQTTMQWPLARASGLGSGALTLQGQTNMGAISVPVGRQ